MRESAEAYRNSFAAFPVRLNGGSKVRRGWYYFTEGETFVWRVGRWVAIQDATDGGPTCQPKPEGSEAAGLWYWNGHSWNPPEDEATADMEVPGPRCLRSLVVALLVTAMALGMIWAIGDRLDWAVCPGQNCNEGATFTLPDLFPVFVFLGVPAGLLFALVDWLKRWSQWYSSRRSLELW